MSNFQTSQVNQLKWSLKVNKKTKDFFRILFRKKIKVSDNV